MKIDFSEQRQRHQPRWTAPASFLSLLAFQRYLASACGALFLLSMLVTIGVAADSATDPSTPTTAAACPIPRCALSTDENDMDYFPYKAIPTISSFSVVYYPSYKVLTETRTQTQFVLYQCGTSRPNVSPTAGFSPTAKFFEVPLKTIAVDESISAGYLELLGQRHAIRFFDVSYVSSPCMLRMANEGQIETFESSYGNATKRAEQIAQVDAYFASNVADPNLKAIPQSSSSDDTLLNRSEWLKFYSYFFNKEFAAMDLWTGIKNRYGQFRLAATEAAASTKPSVGFVNYQAPSSWSPAGSLSISAASYKKDIVEDGGASFPVQADASWPLEKSDEFLSALASAQLNVLLDESYYDNPTVVSFDDVLTAFRLNASLSTTAFPFLGTSAVWREDARGSLKTTSFGVTYADDWFEDAQVESDALLLDFIRIVHPTLYEQLKASIINSAPGDMRIQRLWFRNMGANESVQFETAAQCTDLSAPPLPLLVRQSTQPFHCPDYFYESSSPLPAWAIALIVVGGVAFLVILVLFIIGFRRHRDLQYKYSKLAMEMQIRGQESKATV